MWGLVCWGGEDLLKIEGMGVGTCVLAGEVRTY